jgi:uncharacterized protein (TIGR02001 family)
MQIKKTQMIFAAALAAAAVGVHAQTAQSGQTAQTPAPPAAAATSPFSFNVGVVSDYRFRGISQSRLRPALQGGVDFAHDSGLYVGLWASTIRILEDIPGGKGPVELDIYGGYKGKINDNFSYDVGVLRYQYPRENFPTTVNTTELYGAVTFGPATVKYSRSVGKQTFGVANSRGTYYLEAAATFDLGNGFALTPHIGYQKYDGSTAGVSNSSFASYTDYSLGVTKDMGNGFTLSATLVGTDTKDPFYQSGANGKDLGKTGLVVGAKYAF